MPIPRADAAVGAGDAAGEAAISPGLQGFENYEVHPARGAIARVHVDWRTEKFNPDHLPDGMGCELLQKVRITQKEYADGTVDVEQDEWGETPRRGLPKRGKKAPGAWRGTTWFFMEGCLLYTSPSPRDRG